LAKIPKSVRPPGGVYLLQHQRLPQARAGHFFWRGRGKIVSPLSTEELQQIAVPTLLICGEQDVLFPVAGVIRALKVLPDGELIAFEDSGHDPIKDNEEATLQAVIELLAKTPE